MDWFKGAEERLRTMDRMRRECCPVSLVELTGSLPRKSKAPGYRLLLSLLLRVL